MKGINKANQEGMDTKVTVIQTTNATNKEKIDTSKKKSLLNSIHSKTFVYTFTLITTMVLISFFILYQFLPSYYMKAKMGAFAKETDKLIEIMESDNSMEEKGDYIYLFSMENNATVITFNEKQEIMAGLSSPFRGYQIVASEIMISESTDKPPVMEGNNTVSVETTKDFAIKLAEPMEGFQLVEAMEPAAEISFFASDEIAITTIEPNRKIYDANTAFSETSNNLTYLEISREVVANEIENLHISTTLQPIDEASDVLLSLMPMVLFIDIIISVGAAYFYANRLSRPIVAITNATIAMKGRDKNAQSSISSKDELGVLSRNLDAMYEELESTILQLEKEILYTQQLEISKTEFMQGAGHELKTPLAVINGLLEGMIDNVGKYANREIYLLACQKKAEELTLLVDKILMVAASNEVGNTSKEDLIDLPLMLKEMMDKQAYVIEEKNLEIIWQIDPLMDSFLLKTDAQLVKVILSNIITNACGYSPPGERIQINLLQSVDRVMLQISNGMEGELSISPEALMEPFVIGSHSRNKLESGTGLGLYIVKNALERLQLPYEIKYQQDIFVFSLFFPI